MFAIHRRALNIATNSKASQISECGYEWALNGGRHRVEVSCRSSTVDSCGRIDTKVSKGCRCRILVPERILVCECRISVLQRRR